MDTSSGVGSILMNSHRILSVGVWLALAFAPFSHAEESSGEAIFRNSCASCHSVSAQDVRDHDSFLRSQGPSLANSGNKYSAEWLQKWLVQPVQIWPAGYLSFRHVVASSDGDRINDSWTPSHAVLASSEAQKVTTYLMSLKKEPNQYPAASGPSEIPGKLLFEKIFGCGSCHQAEPGIGGRSGPELYTSAQRLNKGWMRQFISDPQYWGSGLMVKANLGGTQLEAIVDYLSQPKAEVDSHRLTSAIADAHDSNNDGLAQTPRNRKLYLLFCSQCHGVQGNGKGVNAKSMSVAPRNHSSSEEMAGLTDDRLFAAIKFGGTAVGKSSLMPSWATILSDSDIDTLIAYLHQLNGSETSEVAPNAEVHATQENRLSK